MQNEHPISYDEEMPALKKWIPLFELRRLTKTVSVYVENVRDALNS